MSNELWRVPKMFFLGNLVSFYSFEWGISIVVKAFNKQPFFFAIIVYTVYYHGTCDSYNNFLNNLSFLLLTSICPSLLLVHSCVWCCVFFHITETDEPRKLSRMVSIIWFATWERIYSLKQHLLNFFKTFSISLFQNKKGKCKNIEIPLVTNKQTNKQTASLESTHQELSFEWSHL